MGLALRKALHLGSVLGHRRAELSDVGVVASLRLVAVDVETGRAAHDERCKREPSANDGAKQGQGVGGQGHDASMALASTGSDHDRAKPCLGGNLAIGVSAGATLAALFALGLGKGRLVQRSPIFQGLEILAIGAAAAGLGWILGEILPNLLG